MMACTGVYSRLTKKNKNELLARHSPANNLQEGVGQEEEGDESEGGVGGW